MTTNPKGTHMPTDPNRALLRAVEKLTTQVGRIADTLTTPAVTDDDGAQTTTVHAPNLSDRPIRTITSWLPACPSGRHPAHASHTCEGIEAFAAQAQNWARRNTAAERKTTGAVYSGLHTTAEDEVKQLRAELAGATDAINRVRTALDDRPALCTDSVYERGWNDAAEMVRHALAGPTTEG